MSESNPHFPSRISKATLDAAQYAQQQVNSLQSLLGDTDYSIAMSTDISHLLKDASYYASSEAMKEVIDSAQKLVGSIPGAMLDAVTLINSAVESIKTIDLSAIANQHKQINYEQYKPVIDALDNITQNNKGTPLNFDSTLVQDSSDTVTDINSQAIKEHKPVNVIALIGLIIAIYNAMLGTYSNFLKPSLADEQLQIEKDQLTQLQLDRSEDVRHNTISEEQGKETLILIGKMYELLINLTKTETEEIKEE